MKVLCDFHHSELYESLLKVFEDRFFADVYRPIGHEWLLEGCWKIGSTPDVIGQYLDSNAASEIEPGIWLEDGKDHKAYYSELIEIYGRKNPHKRITLPRAKEMNWDIIITTFNPHFDPMEDFRLKYCPSARHILQMGNVSYAIPTRVQNVMNSTGKDWSSVPNYVEYYQEFDSNSLSWEFPINDAKAIYCFLILNQGHRGKDFLELEQLMGGWVFKEYGAFNRDGHIHNFADQCQKMREAGFLWHVKLNGDGYGYNLYRALYSGKPVIINHGTVYKDHRLSNVGLFEEGRTFIDYDGKSVEEIKQAVLRMYAKWEQHSRHLYDRMHELIVFDNEAEKIRKFVENLR